MDPSWGLLPGLFAGALLLSAMMPRCADSLEEVGCEALRRSRYLRWRRRMI
jgi:hypothetical protein